ncbi:MAG: serine/threonine protein kinase [Deltaproteobacteria bacterium]|nr:serine/threonine protein kinase [Deltaproteobacteria bacterium]
MSPAEGPASPPVAVGDVVDGKYRVDRVLGQGAMGVVVAATHLQLEQPVAIKFLVLEGEGVPFERFLREARATARLKGEHVCRVIDVTAREGAAPYIVMEYLAGQDLEQLVQERGTLAITEAMDHLLQACEGLAEAHAAGIVHRDLKPANLYLATAPDGSPTIKVVDFGLVKELDTARDLAGRPALTEVGGMLGSPFYMSPEQIASPKDVDTRTDIWALGVVLYELLTGQLAFPAATLSELVVMVGHHQPKPPSRLRPELAGAVEAIILRCLEKSREARFPTVAHLAAELAPLASEAVRPCAGRAARLLGIAERIEPTTTGLQGASPAAGTGAGLAVAEPAEQGESDVGSTIPLHDDDPVPVLTVETKPAFPAGSTLPMDEQPAGVPAGVPAPVDPAPPPNHGAPASHALAETVDAPSGLPLRWLLVAGLVLVAGVVALVLLQRASPEQDGEPAEVPPPAGSVQPSAQPSNHP